MEKEKGTWGRPHTYERWYMEFRREERDFEGRSYEWKKWFDEEDDGWLDRKKDDTDSYKKNFLDIFFIFLLFYLWN